jgi:LuxR family transcriptional regulator, maltose regulon positive regulatory protein
VQERQPWQDQITIPRPVRHEIGRSALLQQIMTTSDAQLVLLLAPSGYGKTTVLAQLARHLPTAVAWLSLWEGCADPVTFTKAVVAAVQVLDISVPDFSSDRTGEVFQDWRTLIETLNTASQSVTLILDGIEYLSPESGALVVRLLDRLGEGHKLILSGFGAHHIKLHRYLSTGEALVLSAQDLAFTLEDTQALLQVRNVDLKASMVQQQVSGWPVAVGLLASGTSHGFSPESLIEESLESLPLQLKQSLPQAAIVTVWSEPDLEKLGTSLPNGWLNQVRLAGLPITPLGLGRYRPHSLLRQTLLKKLDEAQVQVGLIRHRAALQALARGDLLEAAHLFLAVGEPNRALEAVKEAVERAWLQAEFSNLRRLLGLFSLEILDIRWQAMLAVVWLETGLAQQGKDLLSRIVLQPNTIPIVLYGQVRLHMRHGDIPAQLAGCEQAMCADLSRFERARFERMRANALHNLNDFAGAIAICERLIVEAQIDGRQVDLGNSLFVMQASLFSLHRWSDCETALLHGIQIFEHLELDTRLIALLVDLAELYRVTGRIEESLHLLDRAQPLAEREEHEMLPIILESRGDLALMAGQVGLAETSYRMALKACEAFQYDRIKARIGLRLAEVLARLGHDLQAHALLEMAQQVCPIRPDWLNVGEEYHRGVIAWFAGEFEQAQTHFQAVYEPSSDLFHTPRAAAWLCCIAQHQGHLTQTLVNSLRDRSKHLNWSQIAAPDQIKFNLMVEEARTHHWWSEDNTTQPVVKPNKLELSIVSLGQLEVGINKRLAHIPLTKSFEILCFLALEGPSRREVIVDALWDGSAESRHVDYFKVAIRRLRVGLMEVIEADFNPIPVIAGRFQIAGSLSVSLDAQTLGNAVQGDDIDGMKQVLARYQGDFLPTSDTQWALQKRQGFLNDASGLAIQIGDFLAAKQDVHCIDFYRRAVVLESLFVTGHERLIRALLEFNEGHAAIRAWRDYEKVCHQELGVSVNQTLELVLQQKLQR